jgi:hypothetical protein
MVTALPVQCIYEENISKIHAVSIKDNVHRIRSMLKVAQYGFILVAR